MKFLPVSAAALVVCASGALAGGIDRSGQGLGVIFEDGTYAEFSFGMVSPNVSGTAVPALGGFDSGDMAATYFQLGAALKHSYSNGLDVALIFDQPFGANVDYPTGTGYYAGGATATLKTSAITGVLKYTTPQNFSIYGGVRYQTLSAEASIPFVGGYTAEAEIDGRVGYLVGVAYERPDIALRVALTYNSAIDHTLTTTEFGGPSLDTEISTPQSVNLDFQTGIAADTLLFGSVRWVEWSAFNITPIAYFTATGGASLVSFDNDTISYTLGVGRRFNASLSGALTLGYEDQSGGISSNLGPTDGNFSVGLGGTYTQGQMKVTGGVRYVWIGDAQTELGATSPSANFTDNSALGVGIKVGYSF